MAACGGHETAFRQLARSAHGSGAPVSDRHRPRSGRNSRASFRRMAPSPKGTARRQRPARASCRHLRWFRGLRPRCRSETGAPLPRAIGMGERCVVGGACVNGGVRGPRNRVPTTRPKRARQWSAGLRPASPAQRAKLQGFLSPDGALAKGSGAATTARACVVSSSSLVSRPAAAMPVGDRRSAAARDRCGGALWWWWGACVNGGVRVSPRRPPAAGDGAGRPRQALSAAKRRCAPPARPAR